MHIRVQLLQMLLGTELFIRVNLILLPMMNIVIMIVALEYLLRPLMDCIHSHLRFLQRTLVVYILMELYHCRLLEDPLVLQEMKLIHMQPEQPLL